MSNNNFKFASKLAWGSWILNKEMQSPDSLASFIDNVFENDIFVLDVADIYGGYQNEELLGESLTKVSLERHKYQIVTKANIVKSHPDYPTLSDHYNSTYDYLKSQVERSLNKLQTSYIDLFLIHRLDHLMNPLEVSAAFDDFYKSGIVKHFGVSNQYNSTIRMLQKYLNVPIVTNQIEFSLQHLNPLHDGSLDLALELDFNPMFWSPFSRGDIFKKPNIKECLEKIASRHSVDIDAVATSWLIKHPSKGVVILGSNNKDRISSATKGVNLELSNVEWYELLSSTGYILP